MLHPDAPKGHPNDSICFVNLSVISADWPHLCFFQDTHSSENTWHFRDEAMKINSFLCRSAWNNPTCSRLHQHIHISWYINISSYIICFSFNIYIWLAHTRSPPSYAAERSLALIGWTFVVSATRPNKCRQRGKGPQKYCETNGTWASYRYLRVLATVKENGSWWQRN